MGGAWTSQGPRPGRPPTPCSDGLWPSSYVDRLAVLRDGVDGVGVNRVVATATGSNGVPFSVNYVDIIVAYADIGAITEVRLDGVYAWTSGDPVVAASVVSVVPNPVVSSIAGYVVVGSSVFDVVVAVAATYLIVADVSVKKVVAPAA